MRHIRHIIFIAFVVFTMSVDIAGAVSCAAGKHVRAGGCYGCPAGCYCVGSSEKSVDDGCKNSKGKFKKEGQAGVYTCPAAYPNSERNHAAIGGVGAKSAKECFKKSGSTKIYNETKSCPAGQYLKANSLTCAACPSGKVCKGGTLNKATADQGITTCPSGQAPNSTKTACMSAITCKAGQYLPANKDKCESCSSLGITKYCPGGSFLKGTSDQGVSTCSKSNETTNDARTGCTTSKRCDAGQHKIGLICYGCPEGSYCDGSAEQSSNGGKNGVAGVHTCPAAYPKSDRNKATGGVGAKTAKDCYKVVSNVKYYNVQVSCEIGKYLPSSKTTCAACTDGKYCPGGKFDLAAIDQGLMTCPSGQKPNSNKTACNTSCLAGKYLPANTSTCAACPTDKKTTYCIGGEYAVSNKDQGKAECAPGKVANSARTACTDIKVKCSAGQYLPANSETCKKCEAGKVCLKEETYTFSTVKSQGMSDCAQKEIPNDTQTACVPAPAQTVKCNAGEYLPANAEKCSACKANSACAGGTFTVSGSDSGIKTCEDKTKPNAQKSACEAAGAECSPGQYLPANKKKCEACTAGNICPGGVWFEFKAENQGIESCPANTKPNANKTQCEKEESPVCDGITSLNADGTKCEVLPIKCPAGHALPKGSKECTPCAENIILVVGNLLAGINVYCPGGEITPSNDENVGMKDCPDGQQGNADYTACEPIPAEPEEVTEEAEEVVAEETSEEVDPQSTTVICPAGSALAAGSSECSFCKEGSILIAATLTMSICPGGKLTPSAEKIVGLENCPDGLYPNDDFTECIEKKVITKDQLLYGTNSADSPLSDQCWLITNTEQYEKCVTEKAKKVNQIVRNTGVAKTAQISNKINTNLLDDKTVEMVTAPISMETGINSDKSLPTLQVQSSDDTAGKKTLPSLKSQSSDDTAGGKTLPTNESKTFGNFSGGKTSNNAFGGTTMTNGVNRSARTVNTVKKTTTVTRRTKPVVKPRQTRH